MEETIQYSLDIEGEQTTAFCTRETCETEQQNDTLLSCFKPLSEFAEEDVEWLVDGIIPTEQVTLLAGDGGVGKTTLYCELLAALSAGEPCLLDKPGTVRKPMKVGLITYEDSVSKRLKRVLAERGANEKNIVVADTERLGAELVHRLKLGSPEMCEVVSGLGCSLLVFDPVQAFIPANLNMGSRNAMRDCLGGLIALGAATHTTFLITAHTNKRTGASGRNRISDSADLWDIARSVLMVGKADEDTRYLSNEKNNYAELQPTTLFTIEKDGRVVKIGETTKRDYEYQQAAAASIHQAPKRESCKEWLLEQLDDQGGTCATKEVEARAAEAGFSQKTLRAAREELGKAGKLKNRQRDRRWYIEKPTA